MSAPERTLETSGLRVEVVSRTMSDLLVLARVVHQDVEHEPVELRLGKRVGPLLLDRVLGRQHEERVGQAVPLAADGDLPLLHGLQQRGLGLGRASG